jgi:signal transduction histidine kinase
MLTAGISIDSRFDDPEKIVVSKGEMLQCFSNIIANAIDAMPNGGQLVVCATPVSRPSGDGIEIAVQDSGAGIAQENLGNVFEPFFTTKGSLGTGIGLWVTRQLIEKRGGIIEIATSTAPKMSGTTLKIFIPYALPVAHTEIAEPQLR